MKAEYIGATPEKILQYWFGRVEDTVIPTETRAKLWFGETDDVDKEVKDQFAEEVERAGRHEYMDWEKTPRSQLALLLMLDQFPRHVYRGEGRAFASDDYALEIVRKGVDQGVDRSLSLIERVFYYFPLIHSERLADQEIALKLYQRLKELSLPETKLVYESFFKFASHHYNIVRQFGRFPQRNAVLGRESTEAELRYLKEMESARQKE